MENYEARAMKANISSEPGWIQKVVFSAVSWSGTMGPYMIGLDNRSLMD